MTDSQIKMLRHCVGADEKPNERGYRNRYCTETTNPDALALVAAGLFTGPKYEGSFGEGNGMFYATEQAFKLLGFEERK